MYNKPKTSPYNQSALMIVLACIASAIIYFCFFDDVRMDVEELIKHINVGDVPF